MSAPLWDLRCGRWETALADVEMVDAVICDPPYGARTHAGDNVRIAEEVGAKILYASWLPETVAAFVTAWAARCSGWMAAMTSDDLIPSWRDAYAAVGRFDFAPVPVLQHRPRIVGDGPGSGAVYMMVARPRARRFLSWGSLPCWYESPTARGAVVGGKPLGLMRAIIRDYTRPGDLVCDPCAGGGTTLLAASIEGRRSVGAEMDPKTHALAMRRLTAGHTPALFPEVARG